VHKKLTITLDEEVYNGLHRKLGPRKISQFIENLVRPYVESTDLENAYRQMSKDVERETEALDWIEGTIGDVSHDA
jgi:predicted CopG family antitoxin